MSNPSQKLQISAEAPGKVILFGEHAVVYGHTAYVQALPSYTRCTVTSSRNRQRSICFKLKDLRLEYEKDYEQLKNNYFVYQARHDRSLQQADSREKVLTDPQLLIEAVVADVLMENRGGITVSLESAIPINSGQGSSAALIISTLVALKRFLKCPIERLSLFKQALKLEQLQHGISSGIDIASSIYGGLLQYKQQHFNQLNTVPMNFYLVFTGHPASTTRDCIRYVRHYWNDAYESRFHQIHDQIQDGLFRGNRVALRQAVRLNHRLLADLGVVPPLVCQFIEEIEKTSGVAKISGSGSIAGHAGGTVIVFDCPEIENICTKYGYPSQLITGAGAGATSF